MLGWKKNLKPRSAILACFLVAALNLGLGGCQDRIEAAEPFTTQTRFSPSSQITEVAPPPVIQQLRQKLDKYQPQVAITAPREDEVFADTTVNVQLQIQDLPIFKDEDLGLGPHLHLILDNQPYQAVYSVDKPVVLTDLEPGTHTLRVFASRPWHESFKNEGAYAQTTFHVLTKTGKNKPESSIPLLTYSRPKGEYGAEPIMLDFYLTNAPLHLVAQGNPQDNISDWRIQVTVNGESFVLNDWQPIYLQGFKRGKNWVQLEFLDEKGNSIENAFNNTVRIIDYEPKGRDTLSKLVRGELSAEAAGKIVDQNYSAIPTPAPAPIEEKIEESPVVEEVDIAPVEEPISVEETPVAPLESTSNEVDSEVTKPKESLLKRFRRPAPVVTPAPEAIEETPTITPEVVEEDSIITPPEEEALPEQISEPDSAPVLTETNQKPDERVNSFLKRFRRTEVAPSASESEVEPFYIPSEPSESSSELKTETQLGAENPTLPETLPEIVKPLPQTQLQNSIEDKILP